MSLLPCCVAGPPREDVPRYSRSYAIIWPRTSGSNRKIRVGHKRILCDRSDRGRRDDDQHAPDRGLPRRHADGRDNRRGRADERDPAGREPADPQPPGAARPAAIRAARRARRADRRGAFALSRGRTFVHRDRPHSRDRRRAARTPRRHVAHRLAAGIGQQLLAALCRPLPGDPPGARPGAARLDVARGSRLGGDRPVRCRLRRAAGRASGRHGRAACRGARNGGGAGPPPPGKTPPAATGGFRRRTVHLAGARDFDAIQDRRGIFDGRCPSSHARRDAAQHDRLCVRRRRRRADHCRSVHRHAVRARCRGGSLRTTDRCGIRRIYPTQRGLSGVARELIDQFHREVAALAPR